MLSYKDKTFCNAPNCQNKCGRKLTDAVSAAAKKWWGSDNAPISVGKFCDENGNAKT